MRGAPRPCTRKGGARSLETLPDSDAPGVDSDLRRSTLPYRSPWAPPTTGPAAHHLPLSSAEMVLEAVARAISGSRSFPGSLPRTQEAHLFIKGLFVLLFLSFITGVRGSAKNLDEEKGNDFFSPMRVKGKAWQPCRTEVRLFTRSSVAKI